MGYPGTGNWYIMRPPEWPVVIGIMHVDKLSTAMWYGTVYIVAWHIVHVLF